jgi:hypothetical protein
MGLVSDLRARTKLAHHYLHDLIARARRFIYNLGKPIAGAAVERLLKAKSLVPTVVRPILSSASRCLMKDQNVFAHRLAAFGFNPFSMLVVDLMHEFELGVWKSCFKCFLRILYTAAPGGLLVAELDARLVCIPRCPTSLIPALGSGKCLPLAGIPFEKCRIMPLR